MKLDLAGSLVMSATILKPPASDEDARPRVSPGFPANENRSGVPAAGGGTSYWPLTILGLGLAASAAWCSLLVYGAVLVLSWLMN